MEIINNNDASFHHDREANGLWVHLSKKKIVSSEVIFIEYAEVDANVIAENGRSDEEIVGSSNSIQMMNRTLLSKKKEVHLATFQQLLLVKTSADIFMLMILTAAIL